MVDFEGKMDAFMGLVEGKKLGERGKKEGQLGGLSLFWVEPLLFYFFPLPLLCLSVAYCSQS